MGDSEESGPIAPVMILMGVAVLAVSTSSIFVRWSDSAPLTIALFRLFYSCLLVLPFAVTGPMATRKDLGLMVVSGLSLSAHFFLWITSLSYTSVAESVLLVTTHPVPVALASAYFLRERPNRLQIAGISAAVIGASAIVLLPMLLNPSGGGDHLFGNLLAFLGSLAMVPYLLIGRKVRPRVGIFRYALTVYGVALGATVVYVAATGVAWAVTEPKEHALFLTMALIPGLLGHTLYNYLLKHVPAFVVSSTLLFEPVGAAILAAILLAERPEWYVVLCGAVLIGGLFLIARGERSRLVNGSGEMERRSAG